MGTGKVAASARIRLLEETLGARLFTRERNGIRLTPAGARFLKHAESILNAWNRASQDAALGQADRLSLAVGGVPSLWDILLQDWIHALHRRIPEVALQAEAHGQEVLIRRLLDGALDVAFMFEPPQMAELDVREAGGGSNSSWWQAAPGCAPVQPLETATSWWTGGRPSPPPMPGTSRTCRHRRCAWGWGGWRSPSYSSASERPILPRRMVAEHLAAGRLYQVEDAPTIDRQVFAVFPMASERQDVLERALDFLVPAGEVPPEPHKPRICRPRSPRRRSRPVIKGIM